MRFIEALEPIYSSLPEVKPPETEPTLKKKLLYSLIALVLYFIMASVTLIALEASTAQALMGLQEIIASNIGTLVTAGIGPIVIASLILQLMVGARILNIDLTDPKDRARFQGLQKLFAIVLSFFEGFVYAYSGLLTPVGGVSLANPNLYIVVTQVAMGSIILLYLDEMVGRYGIGSGIGWFIAGGVSASIAWQLLNPTDQFAHAVLNPANLTATENIIALITLVLIFLIVSYALAMHVNIPITLGQRGLGGRYPVKLLYVSVIPVILTAALFANVRMWATITQGNPIIGPPMEMLAWATGSPTSFQQDGVFNLLPRIIQQVGAGGIQALGEMHMQILQGTVYLILFTILCVLFGIMWVKMGSQGPEDIANQLEASGMYIPGFRRDKRIVVKILNKYIPPIAILGSIFVGLLAAFGNMALGTLGSGTGILLTVDILYRIYTELAQQQFMEAYPMLRRFLGR
jgi:preprotein translocase subunit SecY